MEEKLTGCSRQGRVFQGEGTPCAKALGQEEHMKQEELKGQCG